MKTVRVKAKNLRPGDVINGQRIHSGHIHRHSHLSHGMDKYITYVVLRKQDGRGLEMKPLHDETFVVVGRPAYNMG